MIIVALLSLLTIVVIGLVMGYALLPLLRAPNAHGLDGGSNNQALYQARMAELNSSPIPPEQAQAMRAAIELLVQPAGEQLQWQQSTHNNQWLLASVVLVSLVAIGVATAVLRADGLRFTYFSNVSQGQSHAFLTGQTDMPPKVDGMKDLDLLQSLQAYAYSNPKQATIWLNLAQVYDRIDAPELANQILSRLYRQFGNNTDLIVQTAAMQLSRPDTGVHPETIARLAAIINTTPNHQSALMQYALLNLKTAQYDVGINALRQLQVLKQAEPGHNPDTIGLLGNAITAAQQQQQRYNATLIRVNISIAPSLRNQLKSTDTLFVTVKSTRPSDAIMPYAALKLPVQQLLAAGVVTAALTDESAMAPGRSIGTAQAQNIPLALHAKISASGNPMSQSGDFVAAATPLGKPGMYQLHIASTVP